MRATLADAALMRDAGRFVWLELDFDKPGNQAFLARHGVAATPTLFVLDPADERATATQLGGLTLSELGQFLDRGERGVNSRSKAPPDVALARGDELLGRGRMADAAASYREALRLAKPGWPERNRAVGSLTFALMIGMESQACAETAAAEAPPMPRGPTFAAIVRAGFASAVMGGAAPWAEAARRKLEPLAEEAVAVPSAQRDDRFELYQHLMVAARLRDDGAGVARWGGKWLDEIDATIPANDDERSALDIARVDAASIMGAPERVLPALIASERAMPDNYNASLRLAQMAADAKWFDDALAACERGLAHVSGPIGRTWLLEIKADVLIGQGNRAAARPVLEEALRSAREIGNEQNRKSNIQKLSRRISEIANTVK